MGTLANRKSQMAESACSAVGKAPQTADAPRTAVCRELVRWLTRERLDQLLDRARACRVAVVGDLALDGYWTADMTRALLSRETPRFPRPVVAERYAPGAGANVAQNLSALGVARVDVLSVLGDDWRGKLLQREMAARLISVGRLIVSPQRSTTAYIKPLLRGYESQQEDSRLDFENAEPLAPALEEALIAGVEAAIEEVDAFFVADQFELNGTVTDHVREALNRLAVERQDKVFVVDSRCRIGLFRGMVAKPNRAEASVALTPNPSPGGRGEASIVRGASSGGRGEASIARGASSGGGGEAPIARGLSLVGSREAEALARLTGRPVFLTLSGEGALVWADGEGVRVAAAPVTPPLDPVGAGDAFGAALIIALASGAALTEAAAFANLAAAVTVEKLGETGTATPDEIVGRYEILQNSPGC
jgi:bifunctional ADP-heptose synthase (sugar kinase/adenylyltransferase)